MQVALTKTDKFINTFQAKCSRCVTSIDYLHYEIPEWTPLKYSHLLALVLYTDWTELQREFTKTFRKTQPYQTTAIIKQKNREYHHWSKNLREVVEYYGNGGWVDKWNDDKRNKSWGSVRGPFYCGMSYQMVLPQIMIRLNGPCSSTKHAEVALKFGGSTGIIVQLDNNSYNGAYNLRCFDCSWLSNFAEEDEYLWIGGRYRLRIASIIIIENNTNYEIYFEAMYFFDAMITGINIRRRADKIGAAHYFILANLIQHRLSHNNFVNEYDDYINDTFRAYTANKLELYFDYQSFEAYFKKIRDLIMGNVVKWTGNRDHTTNEGDNTFKPIAFPLFPNVKKIVLITTSFLESNEYREYRINVPYLMSFIHRELVSVSMNKTMKIVIRGDHHYLTRNELGKLTNRTYIDSSWISKAWIDIPSSCKQDYNMQLITSSIKDDNGEIMTDILCADV